MKKLKLAVTENENVYLADVDTFKRLKFIKYVEQDGRIGVEFFRYAKGCYDYDDKNEYFVLFSGDEKKWNDWDTDITGPSEWSCYISSSWRVKLIETEE